MSGFEVPQSARILALQIDGVGREHPMSAEKLSPVLSVYFVDSFEEAVDACVAVLNFGGRGHTCVIYSEDEEHIREYGRRAPAFRVLVNTPAPQGSTGITTGIEPSMTLGCGAIAGNSTGDNIGPDSPVPRQADCPPCALGGRGIRERGSQALFRGGRQRQ